MKMGWQSLLHGKINLNLPAVQPYVHPPAGGQIKDFFLYLEQPASSCYVYKQTNIKDSLFSRRTSVTIRQRSLRDS